MSASGRDPFPPDAERYELHEGLPYRFSVGRRGFLQLLGGVVVLVTAPRLEAQESGRLAAPRTEEDELAAWLHVEENGNVTVYTGKAEMGQGIRTSLAQAVAEELRVPLDSVHLVMGDTDLTPFDMGTFGSRTTPTMAPQLRKAAAVAREMLKELAARQWSVAPANLVLAEAVVRDPASGRSAGIGALTRGQKLVRTLRGDVPLTPAERWTVAGRSAPKVNARALVTGAHRYPSDLLAADSAAVWHGKVLRPPAMGATLASIDTSAVEGQPGLVVVHDGDFVGVAASRAAAAERAVAALRPAWKTTPQLPGRELFAHLRQPVPAHDSRGEGRGGGPFLVGSVDDAIAGTPHRLETTYTVAYIAHVPLEPRAAVASWKDGRLTVWTGGQRPFGVRTELAAAFHLPEDKVRVVVPDTGSAYGGKHTGECAIEAARLAKAAGRPVKLVWTREEEFRWAYFRPAGVIDVRSGADADGRLVAWEMHNYNSGPAAIRTPYEVANQRIQFHPADSPLRQGSYRALAATANHFARESHMDEAAAALRLDPVEFRRRNIKDPRLRAVLDAAAERFGWNGRHHGPGRGSGVACGFEKGGYTATCAEVAIEADGTPRIARLVTAFDCGAVVDPDGLRNQIEGASMMGIGGALFEAIEFDQGVIRNAALSRYRVPRFSDVPAIEVVLVDRKDQPSAGAGETPIVGVAPAVAGAIYAATGERRRGLPLARRGA